MFGKLERVKKLKDYAFVHFEERDSAVRVRSLFVHHYFYQMKHYVVKGFLGLEKTLMGKSCSTQTQPMNKRGIVSEDMYFFPILENPFQSNIRNIYLCIDFLSSYPASAFFSNPVI